MSSGSNLSGIGTVSYTHLDVYKRQETGLVANYNELKDDVKEFETDLLNNRLPSISDALPRQAMRRRRFSSISSADSNASDAQFSIESAPAMEDTLNSGVLDSENEIYASQSRTTGVSQYISPLLQHKVTLKKRLVAIYTQLSELKEFIELNQTGFSKICKKFDKSLNTSIKSVSYTHLDVYKRQL